MHTADLTLCSKRTFNIDMEEFKQHVQITGGLFGELAKTTLLWFAHHCFKPYLEPAAVDTLLQLVYSATLVWNNNTASV